MTSTAHIDADPRTILHVDMNAFFASVEQQTHPELRGKPIAVVGRGLRTIVTTASYEARAFGVRTGMAIWEARKCCPDLILVPGDGRKYSFTSTRINEVFQEYTPDVEVFSIDESWLDVTRSLNLFGGAERIAWLIKARIRHLFGITCSVGIAPNKLLAKLASEMQKPDGLTIIRPADVGRVLERMPIRELCGIGRKTQAQLEMMAIRTCGELGRCDEERLIRKFGVLGKKLKQMGQGIDESPVVPYSDRSDVKSVGHSMTLDRDIEMRDDILRFLLQLSERVGSRARRYGMSGKTISLYVRYADFFSSFGRQTSLSQYISLNSDIYREVVGLLDSVVLEQPVRLLGVRLSNLKHESHQLPLFTDERKRIFATQAMDALNERFGSQAVTSGTVLLERSKRGHQVIPPSWRPSGIKKVDDEG